VIAQGGNNRWPLGRIYLNIICRGSCSTRITGCCGSSAAARSVISTKVRIEANVVENIETEKTYAIKIVIVYKDLGEEAYEQG
jgi:hypothetical protein